MRYAIGMGFCALYLNIRHSLKRGRYRALYNSDRVGDLGEIRDRTTPEETPRASILLVMAIRDHLDTGGEAMRVINNYQTYVILSAVYRSVPQVGRFA